MKNILDIKSSFDKHQIEVEDLTIEQVELLCDMYDKQIQDIEAQMADVKFQIETKKNNIRKMLKEMREYNNNRRFNSNN